MVVKVTTDREITVTKLPGTSPKESRSFLTREVGSQYDCYQSVPKAVRPGRLCSLMGSLDSAAPQKEAGSTVTMYIDSEGYVNGLEKNLIASCICGCEIRGDVVFASEKPGYHECYGIAGEPLKQLLNWLKAARDYITLTEEIQGDGDTEGCVFRSCSVPEALGYDKGQFQADVPKGLNDEELLHKYHMVQKCKIRLMQEETRELAETCKDAAENSRASIYDLHSMKQVVELSNLVMVTAYCEDMMYACFVERLYMKFYNDAIAPFKGCEEVADKMDSMVSCEDSTLYLIKLMHESGMAGQQVKALAHDLLYSAKAFDFATNNMLGSWQPGILGERGFDRRLLEWFVSTGAEYSFLKSSQAGIRLGSLKLCEQYSRANLEEEKGHIFLDFHKRAIAGMLDNKGFGYMEGSLHDAFHIALKEYSAYANRQHEEINS